MPLRTITATRYITPLREGGSLPALVEGDDDGTYVLKFVGAGQGARALIAELVAGEIARALGLPVPEIVFAWLDPSLAQTEPDPEIQDLIRASAGTDGGAGLNLALDYLPGALAYDPLILQPDPDLASRIVWFDAYVSNVDRSARNSNMLVWHRRLWLIDHGAALYFHHDWSQAAARVASPFPLTASHVLLPFASALGAADDHGSATLTPEVLAAVVALIPDVWLDAGSGFADAERHRGAYLDYLQERLRQRHAFLEEALRARSAHV